MAKRWIYCLGNLTILRAMLVVSAVAIASETSNAAQPQMAQSPVLISLATHFNRATDLQVAVTPKQLLVADQRTTSATNSPAQQSSIIDQVVRESKEGTDGQDDALGKVTSVSQLQDIQPTDWTFQALQSLVERYGCIAGYPDSTFRGNRALTRYEFAAGVKACLDRVDELIAAGTSDLVRQEDIATLQRLQQEFATELTALRSRVDNLEAQTAQLEAHQFSTTTKLNGEALFALVSVSAGQDAKGHKSRQVTTTLSDRVRLNFDTSFTGKDLLRVRLQALNLNSLADTTTVSHEGDLRFSGANPTTPPAQASPNQANNNVALDALLYAFPVGKNTTVVLDGNAAQPDDFTNTVNPYIDNDGASGALSVFGTFNPIYNLSTGAGIGLRHEFGDQLELSLGYLANSPAKPGPGRNGLFAGPYGAIGQLTIKPSKSLTLGLTYVKSYNLDPATGSNLANPNGTYKVSVSSNSYGFEASYRYRWRNIS